ncbi:hypothetical protein MKK68_02155 [Methylobacterium sp. E-016]|uniref:hypothetical protein n=1 Tax=Methylobacterium sp. E-016 TaxID=2836556 RepID=UPI001FB9FE80|nr:hypothetical protein [Methylobacterium sp. E-016]MCJ2074464.1 hypothetical protein [Methylobacterium sp. E-016]
MLRAARALIGIPQSELATKGKLSARTIVAVEQGTASVAALNAIVGVYVGLGLRFEASRDYRTTSITWTRPEAPDPATLRVPGEIVFTPRSERPEAPQREWGPRAGSKAAAEAEATEIEGEA